MSDIHSKIKKLFALAGDKGASEDEAATALKMAAGLMLKYNIQQKDLGEMPKVKKQYLAASLAKYQMVVANASAALYGCRMVFYNMGKGGIAIIGRDENIEAVQETMLFLTKQLEELYKQALPRGLSQRDRSEFRKTFKWACATRVEQRVVNLLDDMKRNDAAAQAATGSNALVVRSQYEHMLSEADAMITNAKPRRISGSYGSGTEQGQAAGDRVKLRKEIQP